MDNFDESSTDYMSPGCLESDDVVYDEQYGCSDSPLEASLNVEPSLKRKKILKVCRHYSYNLIGGAVEAGWEGHELANLIKLVSCQLGLDGSKLIKLLERTGTGTPDIVCQLMEQQEHGSSTTGCCSFSTPQLVAVFLSTAKNIEHFINIMEQAFEYDLFSLSSPDTLEVVGGLASLAVELSMRSSLPVCFTIYLSYIASPWTRWTTDRLSGTRALSASTPVARRTAAECCDSSRRPCLPGRRHTSCSK